MSEAAQELSTTSLTSTAITQTLAPLPDLDTITTSFHLVTSGQAGDASQIKEAIGLGLEKGLQVLGDVLAVAEGAAEEDIRGMVGEREAAVEAYLGLDEMRRRLDTWELLQPPPVASPINEKNVELEEGNKEKEAEEEIELDDPWGEDEGEERTTILDDPWAEQSPEISTKEVSEADEEEESEHSEIESLPLGLFQFLTQPLPLSALELASAVALGALQMICQRHWQELYPYRFSILEAVPGWVQPSELLEADLLPKLGAEDVETWVAPLEADEALPPPPAIIKSLYIPLSLSATPVSLPSRPTPMSSEDLAGWYTSHTLSLDSLGLLDIQLAWVQHGASLGVPSLDSLGEDLSLLSRLVYDGNLTPEQHARWNLASWRSAQEDDVVNAYLSESVPESIAGDIRSLLMPYLYVLESRAERAGKPSSKLVEDYLNSAILSLPLHLALPVFEASKATIPSAERIIKNDLEVARLALACLYGSQERGSVVWGSMSSIFECLPVWELTGADAADEELTSTTIDSISAFVRPSASATEPPTKKDLLIFFHPLPFASLSRALDILDVQLESGEILARWGVEQRLGELLGVTGDKKEQTDLANKLVRQGGSSLAGAREEGWRRLWDDMQRLASGEGLLKGALGTLTLQERGRIYLGGLLSSGNFDITRKMIKRLQGDGAVDAVTIEKVVLETSREIYISAKSGNLHSGNMKLAYDCLLVAPSSKAITSEREYIEATSRLSSFSSFNLTPSQIRATTEPLTLISAVLCGSSSDAYRFPDLMLDLASKLGCQSQVEKGLVWGMVGRSAVENEDWDTGKGAVESMATVAKKRVIKTKGKGKAAGKDLSTADPDAKLIAETYTLAHLIASRPDFSDMPTKREFISIALELCPSEAIPSILETFRKVESGQAKLDQAAKRRRLEGIEAPKLPSEASALGVSEEERVLGSRTAAKAAKLALDIGGRLTNRQLPSPSLLSAATLSSPFGSNALLRSSSRDSRVESDGGSDAGYSVGTPGSTGTRELFDHLGREEAERVRKGARRALVRGVGWLLGADENEISGADEE
ncbi:hypothetical protein B9479_004706 [Cryptococcus floricola]|uniref:Sec39 domain-containing protein n=1 Tax=Cryptococcus floricola TaxID=2591691 RepID=A0A5D3AV00_9TREE|nr:hypothetical protein B9479_004706 [Cryptococcus floricola]